MLPATGTTQQCSSVYSSKLIVKVSNTRGIAASCDLAAKWEKKWGWKEYQKLPWLFHSMPVWREWVWIMFFVTIASDLTLTSSVTSWAVHQAGYEVPDFYSWTSNTCGWETPEGQHSAVLRWAEASFQDVWQGRCCRQCPWAFPHGIVLSQEPLAQGKDKMWEEGLVQQLQVPNWACLFGELGGAGLGTPPGCSGSPWAWGGAGQGDPRSVAFPGMGMPVTPQEGGRHAGLLLNAEPAKGSNCGSNTFAFLGHMGITVISIKTWQRPLCCDRALHHAAPWMLEWPELHRHNRDNLQAPFLEQEDC